MLTAIGDVMRKCYERGWITTRDGNISLRKSIDGVVGKTMYITPSGVRKNIIVPEQIVKISLANEGSKYAISIDGDGKPSGELNMHWYLQRDAKRSRAVVHVHATHIVAAMHAGIDLQRMAEAFPEISRYTKVAKSVPVVPAVSEELADLTNAALRDSFTDAIAPIRFDIVGQKSHGVCAVGRDPWHAYEHIERLDHICEIVLKSGNIKGFIEWDDRVQE